jgi:N-acetylmuramate 1-kinase
MNFQEEILSFARESLGLSPKHDLQLIPFAGRGSDRDYYRVRWNGEKSAILIHYNSSRIENSYHADIDSFLSGINVPVPDVIRHDRKACLIVMEDLGDVDLWALRNEPWQTRKTLYEKVLTAVHRLHSFPERQFPFDRVKLAEAFGPNLYCWEQDYFRENFVRGFCGISLDPSFGKRLKTELAGLMDRLLACSPNLVHRDLQSQNVMIFEGEPYLIDFQGMRFGNRFYDLGSLMMDPYVEFSETEREELLSFYFRLSGNQFEWESFLNLFWDASAQRLMQALGAYGFLGIVKGLKSYLAHIPAGVRNLAHATEKTESLPCLRELVVQCRHAIDSR